LQIIEQVKNFRMVKLFEDINIGTHTSKRFVSNLVIVVYKLCSFRYSLSIPTRLRILYFDSYYCWKITQIYFSQITKSWELLDWTMELPLRNRCTICFLTLSLKKNPLPSSIKATTQHVNNPFSHRHPWCANERSAKRVWSSFFF